MLRKRDLLSGLKLCKHTELPDQVQSCLAHCHVDFDWSLLSPLPPGEGAKTGGVANRQMYVDVALALVRYFLLAQEARAYGQVRGVIPFSCAYFAADASTRGRTSA
jgi:hypothetical protein